jgi:hypothetical protein
MNEFQFISVLLVTMALGGCIGIAHHSADVPVLEIVVKPDPLEPCGDISALVLVAPVFYGVPAAFRDLVVDELKDGIYYESVSPDPGFEGEFQVDFPPETRHIGHLATPFSSGPSRNVTTSRIVLIRTGGGEGIFKVALEGDRALVQRLQNMDSLGARPERRSEKEGFGAYPKEILDFFHSARWRPTEAMQVRSIERSDRRDFFVIEFRESICANLS